MTLPPEQERSSLVATVLQYEDVVSEVLKKRSPGKKSWWESVGLVSSLTAVITVGLTSWASYMTQARLRDLENSGALERAALEAQGKILAESYSLVAEALHFADERRHIVRGDYNSLQPAQLRPLIDSVNVWDSRWRRGRESFKVSIQVHFHDEARAVAQWDTLVARMDLYSQCAFVDTCSEWQQRRDAVSAAALSYRTVLTNYVARHAAQLRRPLD